MIKRGLLSAILAATATPAFATVLFSDNFDTYTNGNLVGQGGWLQNGATATNPIQVSSGRVVNMTTGQDVYANFSSVPNTDGTFAYIGLTLNLSAAFAGGDYFVHFTNGAANPTAFSGRLAARTSGAGFVLGYSESTNAGTTYGNTELAFNTDYQVILRYGFVNGALNDTGAIFVTSTTFDPVEASNTAYLTDAYNGTTAELTSFGGIQLRQGGSTSAPTASVDNLIVATTFAEAAQVPEPSALLSLVGGVGILCSFRRLRGRQSRLALPGTPAGGRAG